MQFQILNNGKPLTMGELDKSAADFWGVEIDPKEYVAPKGFIWPMTWFNFIGESIAMMPKGTHDWSDVIGYLCRVAASGDTSFTEFQHSVVAYKHFIELCFYWKSLGYVPVTL